MADTWFISDHHLSHAKILTFKDKTDCLIRPEFDNVEQMDAYILEMHNQNVKPEDTVYFLGDLMWWHKPDAWGTFTKMQGNIYFAPGNHDDIPSMMGSGKLKDIRLWYHLEAGGKKMIASHIPTYRDMGRCDLNIHGHLHDKLVLDPASQEPDPRFFSVCVEQLGYEPIHIEDIVKLADY